VVGPPSEKPVSVQAMKESDRTVLLERVGSERSEGPGACRLVAGPEACVSYLRRAGRGPEVHVAAAAEMTRLSLYSARRIPRSAFPSALCFLPACPPRSFTTRTLTS
jgi:hypothetical protein